MILQYQNNSQNDGTYNRNDWNGILESGCAGGAMDSGSELEIREK